MQQQEAASTDSDRNSLRALIEQRTKEWEASNGKVETVEIIKKNDAKSHWDKSSERAMPFINENCEISKAIADRYPSAPCLIELAKELGLPSLNALHNRARRMKVKRIITGHPNIERADKRMQEVEALLSHGQPVKEIAKKLELPERSVRYYRQRLAAINKDADAIEARINVIAARVNNI